MTAEPLAGAVLAGGASRRMGTTKATIELDGLPLVLGVVRAARDAGAEPVVVVGGGSELDGLQVDRCPDDVPGGGPLHAVAQVLEADGPQVVVILACDLPRVSAVELARLVEARRATDADVAVSVLDGRPQWLHAVWHRRAAPQLRAAIESGATSLHRGVERCSIVELEPLDPTTVHDVDRPEDLARYASIDDDPRGSA